MAINTDRAGRLGAYRLGVNRGGWAGKDSATGITLTSLLNSNYMVEYNMKKNVASQSIGAQMVTISDGSDFTGTVTAEVTIDGGTKTSGGGTVTHEGEGYHSYAPTQAETNGDHVAVSFSGSGALTQTVQVYTTFPQTVDNATAIADIPTNAEFNARSLPSADYFIVSDYTAPANADITSILADTSELQGNQGDWATATGFATTAEIADVPTVAEFNARTVVSADYFVTSDYTEAPTVSQILTAQMTESYAADGAAPTLAQCLFLTMQNLQDFNYVGTTQTVKKIDGIATAATYTLNDASAPTSKTRAS